VIKRSRRIWVWLLLVGLMSGRCIDAFSQTSDPQKPAPTRSARKPQGFFDYALGEINPQEKDYGAAIETRRSGAVEHTIDDLYFWSNVLTLFLLCASAAVVLLQWRAADKREVIAASLLAQLWNGRVSDRIEIDRRTEQFNRLVETHNAEVEHALSQAAATSEKKEQEVGKLSRSVRNLAETPKTSSPEAPSAEPAPAETAGVAGLQQSNLLLQRRVEALQNSEQNLKQRLNQTTVLLDQERRRNATLKGA
jgi:hypothetical protein